MKTFLIKTILVCVSIVSTTAALAVGGMRSGGGNFTEPVFWSIVEREIVPELKRLKSREPKPSDLLTGLQINELLTWMDRKITHLKLSTEPLFLIEPNGQRKPVDALNTRDTKTIELYVVSWQSKLNMGVDLNHLILHEFMGLAKINDTDGISTKVFPPRRKPLSFDSTEVMCVVTNKYVRVGNGELIIRDHPGMDRTRIRLSKSLSLNKNPKCVLKEKTSGQCLQYAQDYKIKEAKTRIAVPFDEGDDPGGKYYVDVSVQLLSSYYGYGWGAAADDLFLRPAKFDVVWKLVHESDNGKKTTLNIVTAETEKRDDYDDKATLFQNLPMAAFSDLLERNGFELKLTPYQGELISLYHSYNVAGFLDKLAEEAGYKTNEQKDQYIVSKVLAGAKGNAIPFRVFVSCELWSKE